MTIKFYKRKLFWNYYIFLVIVYNCIDDLEKMQRLIWKANFWCDRSTKMRLRIIWYPLLSISLVCMRQNTR